MKFSLRMRKWHRWLALIVGVQVLLWTVSGLFMSFVPIETVRSENLIKTPDFIPLKIRADFTSAAEAIEYSGMSPDSIKEIKLKILLDTPVYEVTDKKDKVSLIDAVNGNRLSPISSHLARRIALSRYKGEAKIKNVRLITEPIIEYRASYPVWRIDFEDTQDTSFYISSRDGRLKATRGNIWRIYDFLWMLHIMDYSERKYFNHWWLVLAALLAASVTLTGFVLFFFSFKKHFIKR